MDAHLVDFASMLLRWLHVIAGIAWIGSSFYFIWLDHSLEPPPPGSEKAKQGVAGELWAVHGGGFYNPQKYAGAPPALPTTLHWFKWEAYTTWLSGTALLVVVYWLRAGSMMVGGSGALSGSQSVALAAGTMVGTWLVYDALCRSPLGRRDALLGVVMFGASTLLAWVLHRHLGPRAAYLHVGSAIGTLMVANVFFVIIPGQRRMVDALAAGLTPDPADGRRGKQRSVHNNYFTLPVVFIMISNHHASTYGHPHAWAVLMVVAAAGVSIRHFFNRRHKGILAWRYLGLGAALLGGVAWWTAPRLPALPPLTEPATFAQVRAIVGQRCLTCHSPAPTFPGLPQAPGGLVLDSPDALVRNAQRIFQQTVATRVMPLANATAMTDHERAVIAAWVTAGAPAR